MQPQQHPTPTPIQLEAQYGVHNYAPLPVVLQRGQGVWVYDTEGKPYMDFLSAYGAVNQGHCHPTIIQAFVEQAQQLTLTSRAFYNDKLGAAEAYICQLFGYPKSIFMNSGAEAVETAIKFARRWGYQHKGIAPNQARIVVASQNFHGRTSAIVSASTDAQSKHLFGPYMPGFDVVPYNNKTQLQQALNHPNVCAFMVEPVQGEAGVILPSDDYLPFARQLCTGNKVLFVADEIQSGLGRTGYRLACDHYNLRPDMVTLGKAISGGTMPVSVVLADNHIADLIKPGDHGSTYGGNPLAAVVAMASLQVLENENLYQNSTLMGKMFRQLLGQKLENHPAVHQIRGRGLMNAIEINPDTSPLTAWEICLKLMEKGLLAKPTHQHIIRLTPPLVINQEQITQAARIIHEVFEAMRA